MCISIVTLLVFRVHYETLNSNQSKEWKCIMEFPLIHFNVLIRPFGICLDLNQKLTRFFRLTIFKFNVDDGYVVSSEIKIEFHLPNKEWSEDMKKSMTGCFF